MISILNKNNKLDESRNSLNITYPRSVNIIFGNYPYIDVVNNFIINIKNNLNVDMKNYTNVKGGMTKWTHFVNNPMFNNFMIYLINKHQLTHPKIFEYFNEKYGVVNAWGNEIKKGDSLNYHTHPCLHGILYLTKGSDLILPELNLKISPEPGNYYIFPPEVVHGFEESKYEDNRYCVVFNIIEVNQFNFEKKLEELNERKKS
jgi:hypothetical protein